MQVVFPFRQDETKTARLSQALPPLLVGHLYGEWNNIFPTSCTNEKLIIA
jgi:hypothetical protein